MLANLRANPAHGLIDPSARHAQQGRASPNQARPSPVWLANGRLTESGAALLASLANASDVGLDPNRYDVSGLAREAAAAATRGPAERAVLETRLSEVLARYVADLRSPPVGERIAYTDQDLTPPAQGPDAVVREAGAAPSVGGYLAAVTRGNWISAGLSQHLAGRKSPRDDQVLRVNLARARALPADLGDRYVLVDVPARTLWLYDHGRLVLSMPIVVGKPDEPTPTMAALIRYAVFNPYWNVPADLVRQRLVPAVKTDGADYLARGGYEVLSDWSDHASVIDPSTVDWDEVARGEAIIRVRQQPRPDNMMGKIKFMFPNSFGVYLHDSPIRSAFKSAARTASAGCVRLQDAAALGRALLGDREMTSTSRDWERRVMLARPVPVYLVYLTRLPMGEGLSRFPDIYGWDAARLDHRRTGPSA